MTVNPPAHVREHGRAGRPSRSAFPVLIVLLGVVTIACGKKGPPLPPLVKIPVAPGDATAARRGNIVDLQFSVPNANTDNSRPANIERVDVYGITGPSGMSDDQLIKYGKKVASVRVRRRATRMRRSMRTSLKRTWTRPKVRASSKVPQPLSRKI